MLYDGLEDVSLFLIIQHWMIEIEVVHDDS